MTTRSTEVINDAPGEPGLASNDPRWARPALLILLVATATFWTVGVSRNGWANAFYSAAAQAGSVSWKAFLFGSSDGANSITIDEPPASLWPMEISARIFGVNSWSIQLPQVLFGVASVALLYVIIRKHFGPAAGLIAGLCLAITPVATLMFRYNDPDALLAFLMVAAAWALMCAIDDGRTRWLALCGVLMGLGFLTKQLQVLPAVPALAITYQVSGPGAPLRRLRQLLVAAAAAAVSAGWWVLLVRSTLAEDRPHVGGSTDNGALHSASGYSGLGRLSGGDMASGGPGGGGLPPEQLGSSPGLTRMFGAEAGGQISWLLPAALVFLVVGIALCRRVSTTDGKFAQYHLWAGWLIGMALMFSFTSGLYHDYYTVALAPALSAVIGMGTVHLWTWRHSRWVAMTLAGTVALTAVWSWVLLSRAPDFLPALRWVVLVGGLAAAAALVWSTVLPADTHRRVVATAATLALATSLAGPASYSIHTVTTEHTGGIVTAGPSSGGHRSGDPGMPLLAVSDELAQTFSSNACDYIWIAAPLSPSKAAETPRAIGEPEMPLLTRLIERAWC